MRQGLSRVRPLTSRSPGPRKKVSGLPDGWFYDNSVEKRIWEDFEGCEVGGSRIQDFRNTSDMKEFSEATERINQMITSLKIIDSEADSLIVENSNDFSGTSSIECSSILEATKFQVNEYINDINKFVESQMFMTSSLQNMFVHIKQKSKFFDDEMENNSIALSNFSSIDDFSSLISDNIKKAEKITFSHQDFSSYCLSQLNRLQALIKIRDDMISAQSNEIESLKHRLKGKSKKLHSQQKSEDILLLKSQLENSLRTIAEQKLVIERLRSQLLSSNSSSTMILNKNPSNDLFNTKTLEKERDFFNEKIELESQIISLNEQFKRLNHLKVENDTKNMHLQEKLLLYEKLISEKELQIAELDQLNRKYIQMCEVEKERYSNLISKTIKNESQTPKEDKSDLIKYKELIKQLEESHKIELKEQEILIRQKVLSERQVFLGDISPHPNSEKIYQSISNDFEQKMKEQIDSFKEIKQSLSKQYGLKILDLTQQFDERSRYLNENHQKDLIELHDSHAYEIKKIEIELKEKFNHELMVINHDFKEKEHKMNNTIDDYRSIISKLELNNQTLTDIIKRTTGKEPEKEFIVQVKTQPILHISEGMNNTFSIDQYEEIMKEMQIQHQWETDIIINSGSRRSIEAVIAFQNDLRPYIQEIIDIVKSMGDISQFGEQYDSLLSSLSVLVNKLNSNHSEDLSQTLTIPFNDARKRMRELLNNICLLRKSISFQEPVFCSENDILREKISYFEGIINNDQNKCIDSFINMENFMNEEISKREFLINEFQTALSFTNRNGLEISGLIEFSQFFVHSYDLMLSYLAIIDEIKRVYSLEMSSSLFIQVFLSDTLDQKPNRFINYPILSKHITSFTIEESKIITLMEEYKDIGIECEQVSLPPVVPITTIPIIPSEYDFFENSNSDITNNDHLELSLFIKNDFNSCFRFMEAFDENASSVSDSLINSIDGYDAFLKASGMRNESASSFFENIRQLFALFHQSIGYFRKFRSQFLDLLKKYKSFLKSIQTREANIIVKTIKTNDSHVSTIQKDIEHGVLFKQLYSFIGSTFEKILNIVALYTNHEGNNVTFETYSLQDEINSIMPVSNCEPTSSLEKFVSISNRLVLIIENIFNDIEFKKDTKIKTIEMLQSRIQSYKNMNESFINEVDCSKRQNDHLINTINCIKNQLEDEHRNKENASELFYEQRKGFKQLMSLLSLPYNENISTCCVFDSIKQKFISMLSSIDQFQKSTMEMNNKLANLRDQSNLFQKTIDNLYISITKLTNDNADLNEVIYSLKDQIANLTKENEYSNNLKHQLEERISQLIKTQEEIFGYNTLLSKEMSEINISTQKLRHKYDELKFLKITEQSTKLITSDIKQTQTDEIPNNQNHCKWDSKIPGISSNCDYGTVVPEKYHLKRNRDLLRPPTSFTPIKVPKIKGFSTVPNSPQNSQMPSPPDTIRITNISFITPNQKHSKPSMVCTPLSPKNLSTPNSFPDPIITNRPCDEVNRINTKIYKKLLKQQRIIEEKEIAIIELKNKLSEAALSRTRLVVEIEKLNAFSKNCLSKINNLESRLDVSMSELFVRQETIFKQKRELIKIQLSLSSVHVLLYNVQNATLKKEQLSQSKDVVGTSERIISQRKFWKDAERRQIINALSALSLIDRRLYQ